MMDIVDRIKEFTLDGAGYNSDHNCMLLDAISEIESLRAQLAAQPTPSQSVDERAEFESRYEGDVDMSRNGDGYTNECLDAIWAGWQARAQLSNPQPTSQDALEGKVVSIIKWLETNQPDVFRRGLWEAIDAAMKESK